MKPRYSTTCLLNYQFWCELLQNIVNAASKHEMHKRPEQIERAVDQSIQAGSFAGEWRKNWEATDEMLEVFA